MNKPNIELKGILKALPQSEVECAFCLRLSNLTFSAEVPDAYRDDPYVIPVTQDICRHQHPTAREVAETLLKTLEEFFTHEIREAIVIEGIRPFDPHNPEGQEARLRELEKITY